MTATRTWLVTGARSAFGRAIRKLHWPLGDTVIAAGFDD
jgi:NAD(P)-dependent dehydrogenase (short-subunit alcohol dehydrogenase family)